jgi:multidrug efflux pump subunit AcrB
MRPMALNVPVAMFMSMVVAFTVTPWLSYHVLKGVYGKGGHEPTDPHGTFTYRVYKAVLTPFLNSRLAAWGLIGFTALLLAGACVLPALGLVPLKMLPFDNKNEFQVLVDLPEGTPAETTDAVLKEMADDLRKQAEVAEVLSFAGTASPMDFNGMVRHYYLRHEPHRGDLRVNLIAKEERSAQSHAIVLRVRDRLERIANAHNARIKIVEVPPGPPVLSTLVAEVYAKPSQTYAELKTDARHVRALFAKESGVVDIDDTFEAERPRFVFRVDKEKASLTGITTEQIANTLRIGLNGMTPGEGDPKDFRAGSGHLPRELNPLTILIQIPQESRTGVNDLLRLGVKTPTGEIVLVSELGHFDTLPAEQTIYHKNLRRVGYVTAETAGRTPAEAVIGLLFKLRDNPTPGGAEVVWTGEGEWKITLDVFRDLGLAFGGALLLIYILMVYQTGSYLIPLVQMISIPLTVVGIMPGFWLLNLVTGTTVGGYANPVYFTATAMIGMIALAGIADRNAILLLDFIQHVRARGASLKEALIESGAVRFRPILLTAGAAMLGAWPITLDPVFSGLAWALIFGLVVSTAFTLLLVPVVYWMLYRSREGA